MSLYNGHPNPNPNPKQGPMSLYNGFWPNFGRVVPRVMIVFLVMEQLKSKFG